MCQESACHTNSIMNYCNDWSSPSVGSAANCCKATEQPCSALIRPNAYAFLRGLIGDICMLILRSSPTKAHSSEKPAPTNNSLPVIPLLSSDARNTTALAISSGVPSLPIGTSLDNALTP